MKSQITGVQGSTKFLQPVSFKGGWTILRRILPSRELRKYNGESWLISFPPSSLPALEFFFSTQEWLFHLEFSALFRKI